MKHGIIQVCSMTPSIQVANPAYNSIEILNCMQKAHQQGARVLVLPELCLTGYTCQDLFYQSALLESAKAFLLSILENSKSIPLLTALGLPLLHNGKIFNCAAVICSGKLLGIVPKTHLPNYSEFYESRHFHPAPKKTDMITIGDQTVPFGTRLLFACRELPALKVGVEICEDLWVPDPPSNRHAGAGATVMLNLSASNETVEKETFRRSLVAMQSAKLVCAYLYSNAGEGESTTDIVFGGHNIIAENGHILHESLPFSTGVATAQIDLELLCQDRARLTVYPASEDSDYTLIPFSLPLAKTALSRPISKKPFIPADDSRLAARCERILRIQAEGLKKRMLHTGSVSPVLGISGGLDSTLALLVCIKAMDLMNKPYEDIVCVSMPGFGTSSRTKTNAQKLCEAFNTQFYEINITDAVRQHFKDLQHDENDRSVLFENAQARERTQILMDMTHQCKGLVVGTGDLSELALGFATYNGDHMSMYSVNASIPKTLVRHLVTYYANTCKDRAVKDILLDIVATPVSPELLPTLTDGSIAQKTEELIGSYDLNDFFLYYILRHGFSPSKVLRYAVRAFEGEYDKEEILFWLKAFYRRFFASQFKRSCLPDGPKVGSVALSPRGDWRMPSDATAAIWLNELDLLN